MSRRWSRLADDRGFTLIELLSTVIIMGIVFIPLGNFMLEYLQNTTDAKDRISDSHDIQIATAYFAQDVSNVGVRDTSNNFQTSVWVPTSTNLPSPYCGSSVAGASLVLLLSWSAVNTTAAGGGITDAGPQTSSAAYLNEAGVLHRLYCASGTGVTSDVTLVHSFSSAAVVCDTQCDASTPPSTVTLNVVIGSTGDRAAPATVPLIGHRRQ